MYPNQPLESFDRFLKTQLRLQKIVNEPRQANDAMTEKYNTYRVGDKVLVNFKHDPLRVS